MGWAFITLLKPTMASVAIKIEFVIVFFIWAVSVHEYSVDNES